MSRIKVLLAEDNEDHRRLSPKAIAHADQAMRRAKRRGRNRVCTWEMAAFEQTVDQSRQRCSESPEACWRTMLSRCAPRLGPTKRDHLTAHSEYVSAMAVRIGRALSLEAECIERLRIGGLFHDLGKFLIPEEVLAKPGALSPEERVLLARHAEAGAEMSRLLGADEETARYVRYHHTDFGDRISRKEHPVPLGARILAVADAFVAMTSERAYRCGRSFTAAFGELR
ncbi:MAG: HD domain-containing protein, partial [Phycisphaerae bacterium]|nr:HD domain-containing protein [Phycisphaerae bacterium]